MKKLICLTVVLSAFVFAASAATYDPPTVPVLLQILSGAREAKDIMPNGSVYTLPRGKVVEVTIPGFAAAGPVSRFPLFISFDCLLKSDFSTLSICTE